MNYIIYGCQRPLVKSRLKKIQESILGTIDSFNCVTIDYDGENLNSIIDEASMMSLGYEKKVVVIDNATFLSQKENKETIEKIVEMIKTTDDAISLIFILNEKTMSKSSPIIELFDPSNIIEVLDVTKEQWPGYIKNYFKKHECEIDDDAVNELLIRINDDLTQFLNEAQKLFLYTNHITKDDVILMVALPLENKIFEISNHLLNRNNGAALKVFRDINLVNPRETEGLVSLLGNSFRFINQAMYLRDMGLSNDEIAKELNVKSGRVYMTFKNMKQINKRMIEHALDDLYMLDSQIKNGLKDRLYGVELFLINFPN